MHPGSSRDAQGSRLTGIGWTWAVQTSRKQPGQERWRHGGAHPIIRLKVGMDLRKVCEGVSVSMSHRSWRHSVWLHRIIFNSRTPRRRDGRDPVVRRACGVRRERAPLWIARETHMTRWAAFERRVLRSLAPVRAHQVRDGQQGSGARVRRSRAWNMGVAHHPGVGGIWGHDLS